MDTHWEKLRNGNKEALVKIFEDYYDELYNYGLRISRREELTRDSIQDLFIKIWEDRTKFFKIKNPKPYFFRILRNTIIDNLKKRREFSEISEAEIIDPMLSQQDFIINNELSLEIKKKLVTALDNLTTRQKEIIFLKFYSGLSNDEIAFITSLNNQSVRNLLSQALKNLKENMLFVVKHIHAV